MASFPDEVLIFIPNSSKLIKICGGIVHSLMLVKQKMLSIPRNLALASFGD